MAYLRRFNIDGVEYFRQNLMSIRNEELQHIASDLVENDKYAPLIQEIKLPSLHKLTDKLQLAKHLHPCIDSVELENKYYDVGLWAWLAAYYFDLICPLEGIKRNVGQDLRYIPEEKISLNYHRHMIFQPIKTYDLHGDMPVLLYYDTPLHQTGDIIEQLSARQDMWSNSEILQVANQLYYDPHRKTKKVGIRNKAGGLRRYITVLQQLDLTYDLFSLGSDEIISLLPRHEFEIWINS